MEVIWQPSSLTSLPSCVSFSSQPFSVAWRGAGPKNEDQVKVVQLAGLALFDAYVKGNEAAKKWLATDALAKATKAKVRLERKGPVNTMERRERK